MAAEAKKKRERRQREEEQKANDEEKAKKLAFKKLCDKGYDYALEDIQRSAARGKTEAHVWWGDHFRYKFDSEGPYTWDKFRKRIIRRINRNFADYHAELHTFSFACDNFGEAANVDYVSPRTWTEYHPGILVKWEN